MRLVTGVKERNVSCDRVTGLHCCLLVDAAIFLPAVQRATRPTIVAIYSAYIRIATSRQQELRLIMVDIVPRHRLGKIKSNVGRILSLVRGESDNDEKLWLLLLILGQRRYGYRSVWTTASTGGAKCFTAIKLIHFQYRPTKFRVILILYASNARQWHTMKRTE